MLSKLLTWLHRIEDTLLVGTLALLAFLACADIVVRLTGMGDASWISPLLRVLVLWLGLQGALVATRTREHITVDVFSHYASPSLKVWTASITQAFAGLVCAVIAYHSLEFVSMSREFADTTFANLPVWPFQIILPIAFGLMAVRFLIQAMMCFKNKHATPTHEAPL